MIHLANRWHHFCSQVEEMQQSIPLSFCNYIDCIIGWEYCQTLLSARCCDWTHFNVGRTAAAAFITQPLWIHVEARCPACQTTVSLSDKKYYNLKTILLRGEKYRVVKLEELLWVSLVIDVKIPFIFQSKMLQQETLPFESSAQKMNSNVRKYLVHW